VFQPHRDLASHWPGHPDVRRLELDVARRPARV